MNNTALNNSIQQNFDLPIPQQATLQELLDILSQYINALIQKDFERLIFLLYKIDVNEKKLKQILKEQKDEAAGKLIADLIIERQQQKIISKKNFNSNSNWHEDEKW